MTDGGAYPAKSYMVLFPKIMGSADCHCDGRADGRCQGCSCKSKLHWKHEDIIKHNIKQTGRNCSGHSCGCSLVISCKSGKRIIGHKQWRSDQHDPEITFSKSSQSRICAKKMQKFLRCKNPCNDKRHTAQNAPENRLEKIVIRIFPLGPVDPESGGRTNTDHGSDGIYHTIYRKDQIQNSQSVRSGMNRYKKCIRQNINRYPDHTCNTLKNILKKLFQHKFAISFPDSAKVCS